MKFASFVLLLAAAIASIAQETGGFVSIGEDLDDNAFVFRQLQNDTVTPTPAPETPTPTPEPETPKPTPSPSPSPTPTSTPTPSSETPNLTPEPTNEEETPSPTKNEVPSPSEEPSPSSSRSPVPSPTSKGDPLDNSSQSKDPDENKKSSNSGSGSGSSGSSKKKESSGMSTGAVIGIIGGVVAAIGAIAFIIIAAIRKHRDEGDDDPLSPLEIMDKGQVVSQYGREAPRTYVSNNTPPGTYSTNYSQLYSTKNATSPQSHNSIKRATATLAPQRSQMPRNVDIDVDNNLWLSAMEQPHAATTAGAGAVALKNRSSNTDARSFHTSNSYDDLDRARNPTDAMSSNSYQSAAIDDASSLMSGQSDYTNNEFPEYDENRAIVRGSYEL